MSRTKAFQVHDVNNDGKLTLAEYKSMRRAKPEDKGLSDEQLKKDFDALDRDGDGDVETDEFFTYKGGMENGQMHGHGEASYGPDRVYEGQFEHGKRHGHQLT